MLWGNLTYPQVFMISSKGQVSGRNQRWRWLHWFQHIESWIEISHPKGKTNECFYLIKSIPYFGWTLKLLVRCIVCRLFNIKWIGLRLEIIYVSFFSHRLIWLLSFTCNKPVFVYNTVGQRSDDNSKKDKTNLKGLTIHINNPYFIFPSQWTLVNVIQLKWKRETTGFYRMNILIV